MTAPSEMIDGLSFAAAFLLGCLFGLSLERSGVDDPRRLTGVFCLRDFAAPKVMFTAIVAASAAPYLLSDLGLLDLERVYSIPTFFWPQLVGGAVFGTGCAVSGYCPGTAVAGLASGRLDALVALAGVRLGSLLFAGVLPAIEGFYGSPDPGVVTLQQLLGVNHWVVIVQQALMAGGMLKGSTFRRSGGNGSPASAAARNAPVQSDGSRGGLLFETRQASVRRRCQSVRLSTARRTCEKPAGSRETSTSNDSRSPGGSSIRTPR